MREIKFRAWSNGVKADSVATRRQFGEWIFPPQMMYDEKPGDCLVWKSQGQNIEIMQYIGLKDRNGKEIYEGDVVTWFINDTTYTAPIYYDTDQASFWMGEDMAKRCGLVLNDWMRGEYEVIGNIWEHPHLLEGSDSTESA